MPNSDDNQGPWGPRKAQKNWAQTPPPRPPVGGEWEFLHRAWKNLIASPGMGALVIGGLFLMWIFSGVYYVDTDEQGIVLRFGKAVQTTAPGLHMHLPWPIEQALTPNVTKVNRIEIGFRTPETRSRSNANTTDVPIPEESLMLTGDENIVDINFTVFWRIKDAKAYVFNIRNPEMTVKALTESAMREVVGQESIKDILTLKRIAVQNRTQELVQKALDDYNSGIAIVQVQLKKVDPPEQVIDAFRDVQRAKADQQRIRNHAEAYRNEVLPKARGQSERIIQQAEAYKREVVISSQGEAQRFLSVLTAYRKGKDVTTRRMYIETLQDVLSRVRKIILDSDAAPMIPYLPLSRDDPRQLATQPRAQRPATAPQVNKP